MSVGDYDEWLGIAEGTQAGRQIGQDNLPVVIYTRPIHAKAESERQGRPIFVGKPYIKIMVPADPKSLVDRPLKEEDKARFPEAWRRYEERDSSIDGTPLREWPYLTSTRLMELHALKIFTVEQLAALAEPGRIGPDGHDLKKRAEQFLQPSDDVEQELRAEIADLRLHNTELQAQLDEARRQLSGKAQGVDERTRRGAKRRQPAQEEEAVA